MRDPRTVCSMLMAMSGGAAADELNLDAFERQAMDYTEGGAGLDRLQRMLSDLNLDHGMPVKRVHELMAWVRSGEYDRIVGGEYLRRGDPPAPAARRRPPTRPRTTPTSSRASSRRPASTSRAPAISSATGCATSRTPQSASKTGDAAASGRR